MSDTLYHDRERVHAQNQTLGRKRGVTVAFVPERGKGSHGTLYYGEKLTIVRNPKDELKTGTLHAMLTQLGLTLSER
jgi:mRNA interferase HicA